MVNLVLTKSIRTLSVKNSRVASVYFTSMCLKYLEMQLLMANLQLGPFVTAEVALLSDRNLMWVETATQLSGWKSKRSRSSNVTSR